VTETGRVYSLGRKRDKIKMKVLVRRRFLLACFAWLYSWLLSLAVGSSETPFVIGSSVKLTCDIRGLATDESIFMWAKGRKTLFEDKTPVDTRYKSYM